MDRSLRGKERGREREREGEREIISMPVKTFSILIIITLYLYLAPSLSLSLFRQLTGARHPSHSLPFLKTLSTTLNRCFYRCDNGKCQK